MLNRNALLKFASLAVIALMTAGSPAFVQAAGPAASAAGSIALPPAGMGSILLINYDGGSEELDVNFAGTMYKVPPETNGIPSQVEINLAPGAYNYTASVAGNHTTINNTINVVAGKVTSLGFVDNLPDVQNGDKGSDDEVVTSENATGDTDAQADKGSKVDKDSDNDKSEKQVLAHDNDDLLLTVEDVTAQAQ
jgi:hypothetical protein